MNYYKRGELEPYGSALFVFFRATVQGGANMLRALNPFTKQTTYAKARGAIAATGLLAIGLILTTMLRALADDDDDEKYNPYDALDMGSASRAIHLITQEGESVKFPLPFGLPNFTWGLAQIIDRYGRGQISAGEAMYHALFQFHRQVLPDSFPAYKVNEDPTAWFFQTFAPQMIRPFVDIAVNRNHWGNEITYGNRKPGLRDFEKGRIGTDPFYHDAAKWLHDNAKLDTTPETIRHVIEYYAYGPWQGLLAALGSSDWYEPEHKSTRDTLGPFLTALGSSILYGAPRNVEQINYFNAKRRIESELTEKGVRTTDPNNKPGEKAAFVRKQMREGGFDADTIDTYIRILEAEKDIIKINTELREKAERMWGRDLTDEVLKGLFQKAEREKQFIYKRARP
jgi:hypothetical protein